MISLGVESVVWIENPRDIVAVAQVVIRCPARDPASISTCQAKVLITNGR